MSKEHHIIKWLEEMKCYLNRCKDTEWSDSDEQNLLACKAVFISPTDELGPTARKDAYQKLFDYLCGLEKPPLTSEMDDIIFIVKRHFL